MKAFFENLCGSGKSKSRKDLNELRENSEEKNLKVSSPKTEAEKEEDGWMKNFGSTYSTNEIMRKVLKTDDDTHSPASPKSPMTIRKELSKEDSEILESSFREVCRSLDISEYGLGGSDLFDNSSIDENSGNFLPGTLRTRSEDGRIFDNYEEYVRKRKSKDNSDFSTEKETCPENRNNQVDVLETPRGLESKLINELDIDVRRNKYSDKMAGECGKHDLSTE